MRAVASVGSLDHCVGGHGSFFPPHVYGSQRILRHSGAMIGKRLYRHKYNTMVISASYRDGWLAPLERREGSDDREATRATVAKQCLSLFAACSVMYLGSAIGPAMAENIEPVYFGNGCFWGRQYDFVQAEKDMGRTGKDISAVVGYAGGRQASPSNKVCYYYTPEVDTIYEKLGHAEVVQVQLRGEGKDDQFRNYAKTYFSEFRRLKNGKMQRQDPQDTGAGYRNTIGIPGGIHSDLFKIVQEENVNNMNLKEGSGNEYSSFGKAREDDELNTVWIIDSDKFPFYQAEMYHQFHNGLGKRFPTEYTKDLKEMAVANKIVRETGCPEYFFLGS